MTITAVWSIASTADANAGDGLSVTEPGEVDDLVRRLSEPNAGPATIWHEGREPADSATGMLDHDVIAAVSGGYGYLSHIDTDHDYAVLDGDPESPALISEDAEFPAGSGVDPAVLAAALRDFLATGRRPKAVEWRTLDW
ncbi:Imm1 family immunity protein [Saccharopolyspora sp. NPDC047091]|uniref:Imm1 family immunity protein n=1 Tax=Saccharopolyspora sp. NPDC047091 TaxID=3155924 RepID=UPI00340C9807